MPGNGYSPARANKSNLSNLNILTTDGQTILKSRTFRSNRPQLFAEERKENSNAVSQLARICSKEFVEQLCNEHRIEVEKLLLQISRLHDHIRQREADCLLGLHQSKEQLELKAIEQINKLKAEQKQEVRTLQEKLTKAKESLRQCEQKLEERERSFSRQIQELDCENQQMKADLKLIVARKNEEIYSMQQEGLRQREKQRESEEQCLENAKRMADKQRVKLNRALSERDRNLQEFKQELSRERQEKLCLETEWASAKLVLERKISAMSMAQRDRQIEIMEKYRDHCEKREESAEARIRRIKEHCEKEIELLQITLTNRENSVAHVQKHCPSQVDELHFSNQYFQRQSQYLKEVIQRERQSHQREVELLKVKMSVLHENDIKQLTRLTESKIGNLVEMREQLEEMLERKEDDFLSLQTQNYESDKNYLERIRALQCQIYSLKHQRALTESEMKSKFENEKSLLLLASRHQIKQVERSRNDKEFEQEEVRKLRKLLDLQAQEAEESEHIVAQKIKLAEDELQRLSNRIIEEQASSQSMEKKYKLVISVKDQQIKQLNQILNQNREQSQPKTEDTHVLQLHQQIAQLTDQYQSQVTRNSELESEIRKLSSQIDNLMLQNQVSSEEIKESYQALSNSNMRQTRDFFENRIRELEADKRELERLNTEQTENITSLLVKYQQLEHSLSRILQQQERKGNLQEKIINLGIDQNLVKNMAEVFQK